MNTRSIVIQDDPRSRRRRRIRLTLAALGVFLAGVLLGGYGNLYLGLESAWENRDLREQIVSQARQLESLRQWKSDAETSQEIDRAALELVRLELAEQQEAIAELEKGVHFYRSLMAPGEQAEGLSVHSIDLKPGPNNDRYQFRILVQQSARKHNLLTGTLQILVHGDENGQEKAYNLSELSEQVPDPEIRLRFKYFQAIDGELELPAGFTPRTVSAAARATKPRRVNIEKEFPWSVQEKISDVRR